jgi:hypothetical protein
MAYPCFRSAMLSRQARHVTRSQASLHPSQRLLQSVRPRSVAPSIVACTSFPPRGRTMRYDEREEDIL